MPIIETKAYRVGELVFPTIQEAQQQEIIALSVADGSVATDVERHRAAFIVQHTDEIVAILTCAPKTKRPRSDKGTKRKPRTKLEQEAAA